ncbi:hypothetical protein ID866_3689 [Astraeus odoratus]|nr:hypothetical protein ID866_3689 [Astraeus odoratus]
MTKFCIPAIGEVGMAACYCAYIGSIKADLPWWAMPAMLQRRTAVKCD